MNETKEVIIDGIKYIPADNIFNNLDAKTIMRKILLTWATEDMINTEEKLLEKAKEVHVVVTDYEEDYENTPTVYEFITSLFE
jgi:spore coat polysaccharide biosynthesis predicted glycosyltransferase SpsG